ncbi:MAG TPA: M23 family metallopeptidase [Clostridiales bacterium]|nr:M23 family metallopeptidase [Clostridiales bacterium]
MRSSQKRVIKIFLLCILFIIIMNQHTFLITKIFINNITKSEIDYEAYREMKISSDIIDCNNELYDNSNPYFNDIGYITFNMLVNDYDLINKKNKSIKLFVKSLPALTNNEKFIELYNFNKAVFLDLKCFPILKPDYDNINYYYENSWYAHRSYGGDRLHEGTDIFDSDDIKGNIPVVSITDGVVENIGWLEKGGYRIGIRTHSGGYFYYAHLYSYSPNLQKGDMVIAGQLLGFMGNSGYGPEATIDMFPVHLHMGIYVDNNGEMSVNPYYILKALENQSIKNISYMIY